MRKILWISTLTIGIVVLFAGFVAMMQLAQVARELSKLEKEGVPVTSMEIVKAASDENQDALKILHQLHSDCSRMENELSDGQELLWDKIQPATFAQFQKLSDKYPMVFPGIQAFAETRDFNFSAALIEDKDFEISQFRSIGRMLVLKMNVLRAKGDLDESLRTGLLLLDVCRQCDWHPVLITLLQSSAIRGMGHNALAELITQSDLAGLDLTKLHEYLSGAEEEFAAAYRQGFINERVWFLDGNPQTSWRSLAIAGPAVLNLFASEISSAQLSYCDKPAFPDSGLFSKIGYSRQLQPAFQTMRIGQAKVVSEIRILRILLVLATQAKNRQIVSVHELEEFGIPSHLLQDPFTGEPLQIKCARGRWQAWSKGRDQVDHGGDPVSDCVLPRSAGD